MLGSSSRFAVVSLLAALITIICCCCCSFADGIRVLLPGELLLNVFMNGGGRNDIESVRLKLVNALKLNDNKRIEAASVAFSTATDTLFTYIITAGTEPSAQTIASAAITLEPAIISSLQIARIAMMETTAAAAPPADEQSTMKTVLIIGGAALSGALLSLIVAALFCKPRSSEAEERRQRERAEETKAKVEAEMQVQQLVRSAAFQRLQERVIDLEKDEQVRKAIGEVEEHTKKNRSIAKQVTNELMSEPFLEPRDRQIDQEAKESDKRESELSPSEARRRRNIDLVENAPWWHNAQIQAEITNDLAIPRYSGLNDDDLDELGSGVDAAARQRNRVSAAEKRRQTARIPNNLIDYSAVQIISEGHHWLSHVKLPEVPPSIRPQVMVAKSNLHGLGVFARKFIDRGTLLFPFANPARINSAKHVYTANEMRFHFGANWDARLHFVARDPYNKKFCVTEDPKDRGWGALINSCRGSGNLLVANCECVFPDDRSAGVIPWIRVTQTIAPLGELLLDYPFPELIQKQRDIDPDSLDEPPPPSFSTYGASLRLPSMNAIHQIAPRQDLDLPPPPPPQTPPTSSIFSKPPLSPDDIAQPAAAAAAAASSSRRDDGTSSSHALSPQSIVLNQSDAHTPRNDIDI